MTTQEQPSFYEQFAESFRSISESAQSWMESFENQSAPHIQAFQEKISEGVQHVRNQLEQLKIDGLSFGKMVLLEIIQAISEMPEAERRALYYWVRESIRSLFRRKSAVTAA